VGFLTTRLLFIALALVCLVLPWPAGLVEPYYSRGLYPAVQQLMTSASNLLPVSLLDLGLIAAVLGLALAPVRIWRAGRGRRLRAAGRFVVNVVAGAAVLYLCFMVAWGLNYHRDPVTTRLDFDERRITAEAAERLAVQALSHMNAICGASAQAWPDRPLDEVAQELAPLVDDWVASLRLTAVVVPGRPKRTLLDAYFTRAGVSGMTDPLFLETLVASDLLPFERPAVVAHEWAHLAGLARESEASFAGFILCMRGDGLTRYSGWFALFMELFGSLDADARSRVQARVPECVRRDWRAVVARNQKNRQPVVGQIAWRAYDSYLKSNRVESGVRNYSEVVRLTLGTRFDAEWRPIRGR